MIINGIVDEWAAKGHEFGTCMSHPDSPLMYINIPKNASSWTKPNLIDWGWQFYNFHTDNLEKKAIVVLRDPIERWVSGISEYLTLYHPTMGVPAQETVELIFDRVCFDDHTERQIRFIDGLDTDNCIFLLCDGNYRSKFSQLLIEHGMPNRYQNYDYQHTSEKCPNRSRFKKIFSEYLKVPTFYDRIQFHYKKDYELINSLKFY
jgi:hypothetical protein